MDSWYLSPAHSFLFEKKTDSGSKVELYSHQIILKNDLNNLST